MDASTILYTLFSCLVLFSNSVVIIVIVKSRELHLPTLWNIAFMAAWDFSYGLYYLAFVVPSKILGEFAYSEVLKTPASILFVLITGQTFSNVLVALMDRYISVHWSLHYLRLMSAKRFTIAIVCVTCINVIRVCIIFLGSSVVYNVDFGLCTASQTAAARVSSSVIMSIVFIIIIVLIVKLCLTLKSRKVNEIGRVVTRRNITGASQFKVTMVLSGTVLIICYLPWYLVYVLTFVLSEKNLNTFVQFGFISALSNSLWNIVIYGATYKPFKDATWRLFCPSMYRERCRRKFQMEMRKCKVSIVEDRVARGHVHSSIDRDQ